MDSKFGHQQLYLKMIHYKSWQADLASQFWEMESSLPQDLTFHWCNLIMIEMGS